MERKSFSSEAVALLVLLWAAALIVMRLISGLVSPVLSVGWMKYLWTGIVELSFILLPLLYLGKKRGVNGLACLNFSKGDGRAIGLAVWIAVTAYPVMLTVQGLWLACIRALGCVPLQKDMPVMQGLWGLAVALFSMAGCAAFAEEIALRGILLPGLRCRMGNRMAIFITAAIFAGMHGSFSSLPYTFLAGWLLCWMVLRTRSLYPAMAFHFTNNAIAVLLQFLAQGLETSQASLEMTPQMQMSSLLGLMPIVLPASLFLVAALFYFRRHTPGAASVCRETDNRLWWLPLAAGALVYLIMVAESAAYEFSGGAICVSMWYA